MSDNLASAPATERAREDKMKLALARLAVLLVIALGATPSFAEKIYAPGISDTEIKFGQTLPLSGPVRPMARSAGPRPPISA